MTFNALVQALSSTGIPFKEGAWEGANKLNTDYGVYALDGSISLMGDNKHAERMRTGTVDLFALRSRGDIQAAQIEAALDNADIVWRHNYGPHYEADTGFTHWEWVFEVLR